MPLVPRRPLAGLAALGAVAVIAGCGGGSDSLSAEEFRTQADAICTDYDARTKALATPTSAAEVGPFLKNGLKIQSEQLAKLRDLAAPSDLADTYDEALGLLDKQLAVVTTASTRLDDGEDATSVVAALDAEVKSLNDQADAKATELGLKVCGADDDETATSTTPAATAPTAPAPTATAPTAGGTAAGYLADVRSAATALGAFGALLQGTTSLDDLKSKTGDAQARLDDFDAAIAKLDGYSLDIPRLDDQRTGLARTGPKVSDVLRRFLTAAGKGDVVAVQSLLPEVTTAITDFQKAATG